MSYARFDLFPEMRATLARLSAVLTHPARLQVIALLRQHCFASFESITETIPLSQPVISQHLQIMVRSGIIRGIAAGKQSFFALEYETWNLLQKAWGVFSEPTQKEIEMGKAREEGIA